MLPDLQSSRDTLLAICASLSAEVALRQPSDASWSIAAIVEHLAISERRALVGMKRTATQSPANPESLEQTKAVQSILDQHIAVATRKAIAPEATQPINASWPGSLESFLEIRQQTLDFLQTYGDKLGAYTMQHPLLGTMTLVQWLQFTAAHTVRHTTQIRHLLESK